MVRLALRAYPELRVHKDQPEMLAHKDSLGLLAGTVRTVNRASPDHQEYQDRKERQAPLAPLVLKETLAHKD